MPNSHPPRGLRPLAAACGLAGYLATTWLGFAGYVLCSQVGGPAVIEKASCCACDQPLVRTADGDGEILPAADGCGPCSDTSLAGEKFVRAGTVPAGDAAPPALAALVSAPRLDLSAPRSCARSRAGALPPRAALALRTAVLLI